MKALLQPIPEAFAILKRDNPTMTFRMSEHSVWLQSPKDGQWQCIITTDCADRVIVFGPGERTLAVSDETFQKVYQPTCTA
jgi:hypothetical protein